MAGEHIINYIGESSSDVEGFKREIGKIVKNHLQSRLSLDKVIIRQ